MRPLEPSGRDPIFGKAVQDALEAIPEGLDALALVTRLSRALVPELARRAASLHVLRLRSRDKFPRLAPPFLTALGLEQASSEIVAERRAARVAASAPGSRVLDATCGIGGDLLALAAAGVEVVGADRDAECAAFARANLESHRLPPRVVVADASRPAVIADHLLLDPDRRAGGRRSLDPRRWSPDLESSLKLASGFDGACLKLAPALDIGRLEEVERVALDPTRPRNREWISRAGELVELCLWTGSLADEAAPPRRATRLEPGGGVFSIGGEAESIEALSPGAAAGVSWIADPDPAVIRSGLLGHLARRVGLAPLAPRIAYLGGDEEVSSPFLRTWRVLGSVPLDPRRVRALLRDFDVGPITVRKRGHPDPPAVLEKRFRGRGSRSGDLLIVRLARGHRAFLVEKVPLCRKGTA